MKNIFPFLFTLICACQPSSQSAELVSSETGVISLDSLKKEVLAIHDEVMPKMGALMKAQKTLNQLSGSLGESDSLSIVMKNAATDLDVANESMMVWMRNYEPNFEGTEEEQRAYFEEQKKGIQKVKEDMEQSLATGEEIISRN